MKAFLFSLILVITSAVSSYACEFRFEIVSEQKTTYKIGDEVIVKVKLIAFHPFCAEDLKNVKFTTEGVDVLGTTDWQLVSTSVYERKVKMRITGTATGEAKLTATRLCLKMGGTGTIVINSEPKK
ncbi:MAG: hypothetical protein WCK02_06625 [Bacteroidota bacterium]